MVGLMARRSRPLEHGAVSPAGALEPPRVGVSSGLLEHGETLSRLLPLNVDRILPVAQHRVRYPMKRPMRNGEQQMMLVRAVTAQSSKRSEERHRRPFLGVRRAAAIRCRSTSLVRFENNSAGLSGRRAPNESNVALPRPQNISRPIDSPTQRAF
jgi:hypothetical protein